MQKKYKDIFRRVENKYLVSPAQYEKLRPLLDAHMEPAEYPSSAIRSLYFDTPDYRLMRSSLAKPAYKEKLRLRSYTDTEDSTLVFVELKKKYEDVVYKRRVGMLYEDALAFLSESAAPAQETQISREIAYALRYYGEIRPVFFIYYDRISFCGINEPELRLTFDSNILWRGDNLDLRAPVYGTAQLPAGYRVMEIKIPEAMPLWLCHILSDLKLYPTSFSKAANAYRATLADARRAG